MQAHVFYAIKEIRRRKFRTAVNILGYVFSVAFMVMLVLLAQSYSLAARAPNVRTAFADLSLATTELVS